MLRIAIMVALALSVTGCSKIGIKRAPGVLFDGQKFRASAKSTTRSDRQHFVASVKGVSKSFDGAVEAAEYQGTRHCLKYYGTSDIDWDVGPDTPREALVVDNDTLTFLGMCRDD
ncbi:hypothetical protein [Tropicibacter naphthalenivorans]|uniref:Lipoprotein n=1 Tax=Tropicibacter naphthalenivorans TaxID=441103 RepID=A0A0N7M0F2_9RHOB|nr:hypothetical protein [Tropicibacter naphthalenivorans]CUH80297.1 hypothetical protein TRN7648_02916 [Tropicibacter naphthalenivorans]SMC85760.1 hypothetical protein SAMN04488093_105185 [Tropicibacter naphthalenivorans]